MDKIDKSVPSAKTANTIKSLSKTTTKLKKLVSALQKCDENRDETSPRLTVKEDGSSHSQEALERPKDHHPEIVLLLDHMMSDSKVDTAFVVPCSEKILPKLFLDIVLFGKQKIAG